MQQPAEIRLLKKQIKQPHTELSRLKESFFLLLKSGFAAKQYHSHLARGEKERAFHLMGWTGTLAALSATFLTQERREDSDAATLHLSCGNSGRFYL